MLFDGLFIMVLAYLFYCIIKVIQAVGWWRREDPTGAVGLLFAVIIVLGCYISMICGVNSSQIHDNQSITMVTENIKVFQKKYDAIGLELKTELSKYPEYEKDIFEKISPEAMSLYFVKYPELKSIESVTLLTTELVRLHSVIYDQQIERNRFIKDILYRNDNKLVCSVFMKRYDVNYE